MRIQQEKYIQRKFDVVPRRPKPIEKPPVRLKMFSEEWFTTLHSKTGATGSLAFVWPILT